MWPGLHPQYSGAVPGNVRECSAVNMLNEFGISEGAVSVMDRGYNDKKLLNVMADADWNSRSS
ncbi:MAG: hypothetical protein WCR24_03500 [Candidatus Methanomethylophilaceae archaeon]